MFSLLLALNELSVARLTHEAHHSFYQLLQRPQSYSSQNSVVLVYGRHAKVKVAQSRRILCNPMDYNP